MKTINHILIWMLDKTYKDFMPTRDKVLTLGCDLETALIPDLLQTNMLRFVPCCTSLMDETCAIIRGPMTPQNTQ